MNHRPNLKTPTAYPEAVILEGPEQVDRYIQKIRHANNDASDFFNIHVDLQADAEYTIGNRDGSVPSRDWNWSDLDNFNVSGLTEKALNLPGAALHLQINAGQTDSGTVRRRPPWISVTHELIDALEEAPAEARKAIADAKGAPS